MRGLGPFDLDSYCRSVGYQDAELRGSTAYDWRCVDGGRQATVAMTQACRWQYKDPGAIDRIANFYNPEAW